MKQVGIIGCAVVGIFCHVSLGTVYGPGPGGAIPDAITSHTNPGTFNSTINVPTVGSVVSVNSVTLTFGPNHTFAGDIQAILTAPNGVNVHLFSRVGATGPTSFGDSSDLGGTYVFVNSPQATTFEAAAAAAGATAIIANATYQRSTNPNVGATIGVDNDTYTIFNGVPANGNWTLTLRDWGAADIGNLTNWSIDITVSGGSCTTPLPACNPDVTGDNVVNVNDLLAVINTWGQTGPPRPLGDCFPLPNGDCFVNVNDLLAVINGWGNCAAQPTGACWLPNNTCTVNTQSQCNAAGGLGWVSGANCTDSDGDRIPNAYETNSCNPAPIFPFVGTNPNNPDTDNDGLRDGDEVYGSLGGLNLPAFGCNPCRKDILVETDWLRATGQAVDRNKLHINQVNRIIAAFNNAPVTNPNGVSGIKIHIDYGQAPYSGGNAVLDPSGNDTIDLNTFGIDGEFITVKNANFAANRHGYFHYCILHDKYSVGGVYQNSSGVGELPGDDFVVSMGQWALGDHNFIGNTFVHELGHNLALLHGGNENRNFKPNYNSVMNYWHQFCGVDTNGDSIPDGLLDYSRGTRITLNENSLSEPAGVTGVGPAIDWNQNGSASNTGVARNVNCRLTNTFANSVCFNHVMQTSICGTLGQCNDSGCDTYSDFNDWLGMNLNVLNDADLTDRQVIHCWLDGRDE